MPEEGPGHGGQTSCKGSSGCALDVIDHDGTMLWAETLVSGLVNCDAGEAADFYPWRPLPPLIACQNALPLRRT
ncbi:MAG: hypothetical protein JNM99_21985 [Verrucomicrobiaceae bacterium]|nr:hypothetical protein [Verrucomicrobiaceae bacterium]